MALNGTYKISAETPIGKKDGTITFAGAKEGGKGDLDVTVKIDGVGTKLKGATYKEDSFKIEGEISILIATTEFVLKGKVSGDKLKGRAESGDFGIDIEGKRA